MLKFLQKHFKKLIYVTIIHFIVGGFWFQYIHKGNWDDVFNPDPKQKYARLTQTSLDCINCHGKTEIIGAKEFTTRFGKQRWQGYEAVYIDPHTKIKTFQDKKTSFIHIVSEANASQYDGLGNHPVGVPYPQNSNYKYPVTAPILLPNNYIQCESCHVIDSVDNNTHGDLIMELKDLCIGCHNK